MRLSVRAFALQLGVAARTIVKWEASGAHAALRPDSQALLDTMLKDRASEDDLHRFAELLAGVSHNNDSDRASLGPQLTRQGRLNPVQSPPTLGHLSEPSGQMEAELMDAADESADWLPSAEATNVGDLTVEELHSDVRRITGSYLTAPTLPLFNRTRALRDRAFTLLSGRQRPAQTRELYVVAGWSLTLLAWMTVDLGRPDVAESHARTARACAENADHDQLRAWVCATQHTAAFWQDDYMRAATYAAEGLEYATGSAALFLASVHALDLARSGQTGSGREALVLAKRTADTAILDIDEMLGPLHCTPARAAGLWADTHFALDEARPALEISESAMRAFERVPDAERNHGSERMVRLLVTRAHLMLGEYDGAAEALAPVLQTPSEHRVRPLLHRVGEVRELAAAPAHSAAAITAGLVDEISEFVQHPAAPA